ncbi:heterokaryon incompatibility (het-6OR allele) [Fusarium agapanthi]|uniref:Heterokaryon incompatibility (Het-6OR allele) n=1 Tax=Fusarium agapanthi TaxID=1803897 RepID=A0A9P5BCY3_9HYPO|nr:heterokaryon incompatibility (het-6OR allele) [Fusarium agapanthi]
MKHFLQILTRSLIRRFFSQSICQASSRLYKPLNPGTSEIRLLKIPPNPSSEFDLVTVSLDDEPKGSDLPNNHLNDPWSAVTEFLQHQYWQRVWIFQEIVLAKQLVFISSGEANLSWSMLRDTPQSIISVAKENKPDFLPDTAWDLLSNPIAWGKLSWLFLAQARTKIPDPDGFKGWAVSTFAANLLATDDRDYIYGLLGVSGIPVVPDYSPKNTTSQVYTKYIAGWLKAARTQQTTHVHSPLAFLSLAGTGEYGHSDLPSWVPDYRNWGKDMGHVTLSTNCRHASDAEILASFMSFANSFTTRNSKYVTGIPAAQAIIRLVSMDKTKNISQELVDNSMNLAMLITYFNMSKSQTVTKTWSSNWDHDLLNMTFPPSELAPMKVRLNVLEELSSWSLERRRQAVLGIMPVLYNYRFFETSRGYLGAVNFDVLEGDRLCVLWGYKEPVILRPDATDRYTFVGPAYAVDADTENTSPSPRSQGQWFELR